MRTKAILAATAATLAVGGAAYAASSDSGTINACYGPSGALRYSSDGSCKSNETAISWNQTGPQGPGGVNGVSGYQIVTEVVPYSGSPINTTLPCPAGKKALSGGQSGGSDYDDSWPTLDGSGWNWYEMDGPATLYVVCAYAG